MLSSATAQPRPLVLAVAATLRDLAIQVATALSDDASDVESLVHVVSTPGGALRLIHQLKPGVVCACMDDNQLDATGRLIGALHQRRPELPVVAVSRAHDAALERVVRGAGVALYFPLADVGDAMVLRDAVELLASISPRGHPPNHTGLSPPSIRAGPPVHVSLHTRSLRKLRRSSQTPNPQGELP